MSATSRQAVHLKAFHAYAAAARDGSLTEARTATSPGANSDAGHIARLLDGAMTPVSSGSAQ